MLDNTIRQCNHTNTQWEFVDCSNGEEVWKCLGTDCGQTILRYIDCGSGG